MDMEDINFNTIYNDLSKVIDDLIWIKEWECKYVEESILDLQDIAKDVRHLQDKVFKIHGCILEKNRYR